MAAVQHPKQPAYGEAALIPKERYLSRDWLELEYQIGRASCRERV